MVTLFHDQERLDDAVAAVIDKAKLSMSIIRHQKNGTPHFTNHTTVIDIDEEQFFVKVPKMLSFFLYNLESSRLAYCSRPYLFMTNGQRLHHEADALDRLFCHGVRVPERVNTSLPAIVLPFYNAQATHVVLRHSRDRDDILADMTEQLFRIHQLGLHGETTIFNSFVHDDRIYWADFERFYAGGTPFQKSMELKRLICSAAHHASLDLEKTKQTVLSSYPDKTIVQPLKSANTFSDYATAQ